MKLDAQAVVPGFSDLIFATGTIYFFLSVLWMIILVLFIGQYRTARIGSPTLSILLAVLAIDSFRTLFESVYFGLLFNSYLAVHNAKIHEILENPLLLAIPKTFNGLSGLLVLSILVFRLVPIMKLESIKIAAHKLRLIEAEHNQQLREQNAKLMEAQAIAKLGNWETIPNTFEVIWAPETFRIFELSPDVFIPTHEAFLSRVHPDDREIVDAAFQASIGNPEVMTIEHRILIPNGEFKYVIERWQSFLKSDGSLGRILGTCQDVTEHRRSEILVQQAQRRESIGQLTGGIAHDFNNLLTVILGNSEILSRPKLKKDEIAAAANAIALSADRGTKIVSRLLAFTMRQPLKAEITNLNDLIEGIDILRAHALRENIQFKSQMPKDLWLISVDVAQMENAILNLYINARDAMPNGGFLFIETANFIAQHHSQKTETEINPGEYVSFTIQDSGIGMSAHTLQHAFDPFFSTKAGKFGSGLGLSMVYGFIKQSKGHIQVFSEIGKGTTFKIFIPRAVGIVDSEHSKPNLQSVRRGNARILIVEDDSLVRENAVSLLLSRGYQVSAVENGDSAVKILRGKDHVDLVFTDLIMPGQTSGEKLIQIAKKLRPHIALLATSGFVHDSSILEEGSLSAVNFIAKPYGSSQLIQKIEDALNQVRAFRNSTI